ncbi:hypothetical protein MNEG_0589 [Monoraphidium neglectum]|uniref:Uncharacterized protein n=1 Tax=Monoraphidium neglectum TaxID=145388 RepID=A0A0D2KAU6_9CHLO|nr:hypothetical protein MNEG_0589 [Monoraphidium neglectum]KIZ07363.1 hypothetical protein MNEG_0589 [Monoraphidium neglectum]|eukprot:XP_013906382.1 hypothetical protein MNEG_0589 [Monoraphidium neglectum]
MKDAAASCTSKVPRFSAHSVEALKRELLELDYRSLLSEDVMAFEAVRKAVDATAAAAQRIKAQERAQAALAQAQGAASKVAAKLASNPQVQQLEKIAQDTAGNLAGKIDAALSPDARGGGGAGGSGTSSGGGDPGTLGRLAAAESAAGRVPLAQDALLALGSKVGGGGASYWRAGAQGGGASGSAGGATATGGGEAAAGVPLYAPGRILWLRPLDEEEPEAEQKFELVDTGCETRFQRIVLRASCVSGGPSCQDTL